MVLSNADRQRLWRERHRDEPRGNKVLLTQLAALQAFVAQLEAELAIDHSGRPGRLRKRQSQLPHFGFPNARKPAEMLGSHWVGMNCGAKLFGGVKSEIYCAHRRDPIL